MSGYRPCATVQQARRTNRLAGFAVCVLCVAAGLAPQRVFAAGDANRASCPSETEASPGFRTYLPDCRAYEMVSPPFKSGAAIQPEQIALDGQSVIAGS